MKTIATKKLNLDLETVRTLTGDTLSNVVGGRVQGIVPTDTPSNCFKCPLINRPDPDGPIMPTSTARI